MPVLYRYNLPIATSLAVYESQTFVLRSLNIQAGLNLYEEIY